MCLYVCICKHTRVYILYFIDTFINAYIYIYIRMCKHFLNLHVPIHYMYIYIYIYIVTYMYISLHICSPKWKCKVESTCFPVGWKFLLTPAVCEQTLRYGSNELSAPKGCKAGNEGIHISSGYELFPKKDIIYIYICFTYT